MSDEPRQLNHLQRYLVEEAAEDFQHGQLTRRQALKMIAGVLGSLAAANSFLAACAPATQPAPLPPTATAAGSLAATQAPTASPLPPTSPVRLGHCRYHCGRDRDRCGCPNACPGGSGHPHCHAGRHHDDRDGFHAAGACCAAWCPRQP